MPTLMLVLLRAKRDFPHFIGYPNFIKNHTKLVLSANSSSCTTTSLSKVLTSCKKTYEREGINYFWSIKNSTEILSKLKAKGFQASNISTYDFSTLYTTLPHNLIKNQLIDLIEHTFKREEVLYLACNAERAFFTAEKEKYKNYSLWTCQKVTDALVYLLDNIYILDLALNFIDKM